MLYDCEEPFTLDESEVTISNYDCNDSDTEIHQLYGAWGEKKNYGKVYMGAIRSTFIIGQDGIIQWCGKGVKSKGHVERLLKILDIENQ